MRALLANQISLLHRVELKKETNADAGLTGKTARKQKRVVLLFFNF